MAAAASDTKDEMVIPDWVTLEAGDKDAVRPPPPLPPIPSVSLSRSAPSCSPA
jgi:hypothetical protein